MSRHKHMRAVLESRRTCATCPEMDNPDSYIAHLHSALEVADGGVGTCKDVCASNSEFTCSECGFNCDLMSWISLFDGDDGRHRHHHQGTPNYCPNCGARIEVNG